MDIFKRKMKGVSLKILTSLLTFLLVLCCASTKSEKEPLRPEMIEKPPLTKTEVIDNPSTPEVTELKAPEFKPVKEEVSPIYTRVVSISARNTPLRDVLYTIAETVNLNVVMERGVNPEIPITMTLTNVTVHDALEVILNSVDYFYSIKDNILVIKAMKTEIFELGQPNIIQTYQTDLGGDILGGSIEGGEGAIKGEVSMKAISDKIAFQFWDALEKSLTTILQISTGDEAMPQPSFTINRMTGSIMVTASKKGLEKVERYINNLKKALNRQVLIEARIVEVQLSEALKYGINWDFIEDWKGVGSIDIGTSRFSDVVETSGPSFQIGVTGQNFTSLLKALQEQGEVRTLSNPRVNILNGQTALLTVGRNTSFISRVETTTTTEGYTPTITYTIETKSILSGIMFGLVPYISEEGEVTLTITPIVSNLVELKPQSIGSGDNIVEIKLPTVDLREMSSTVKVSNGEMVVIGGLIDRKERLSEDKVPILGDIPVIGGLFKSVDKSYAKTELVIMLMPKILSD
jgi:MSHA type pilus biogenesis protein MshL